MSQLSEPAAVRRLYDRLGFGAGGDAGAAAQHGGFDAAVEDLLHPAGADTGTSNTPAPRPADPPRPGSKAAPPSTEAKKAWRKAQAQQRVELTGWWLDRMVAAEHPATERLTWFWHGHFATSTQKVKSAGLMLEQNATLRRLGRGHFRDLAHAMVVDPAMLVWLDGNDNTATAPNENLSREFMELFTLGHGHFSETDVREGARALTGWRIDRSAGRAVARPKAHDTATKTLLGTTGNLDAARFVDVVLAQPAAPAFVAGRLWFRLVSTTPPDATTLAALVQAYGIDGDITALLRTLTAQPAFRDTATTLVKQPVEWLVGLLRALGVRPAMLDQPGRTRLLAMLRGMGQVPFAPPSVGGWPAGGGWLTTAAALSRVHAARLLVAHATLPAAASTAAAQVEQTRRLLGVDRFSARTSAAIDQAGDLRAAVAVAACSPEYVVSG